jgi:stearoyl-CoA desaturase (delta-9 desaturase)
VSSSWSPSLGDIGVSVALAQSVFYLQSVYLHRCLAHSSVSLHPTVRRGFRILTWLLLGSDPREWVASHRLHHRYADVEGDPHSPIFAGLWNVSLRGTKLIKEACRDRERVARLTRDMPPDMFESFPSAVRRYGGIFISLGVLLVAFGPMAMLWTYALAYAQVLAGVAIVNGLGHLPGPAVTGHIGRNLPVVALFTAGESLHANHHAAPARTYLAIRRWELDPGWWLITGLARLGLAVPRYSRRRMEMVSARQDRGRVLDRRLDASTLRAAPSSSLMAKSARDGSDIGRS